MKSLPHKSHSVFVCLVIFALTSAGFAQHRASVDKSGNLVVTNTDHGLTFENLRTGETTPLQPLLVTTAPPPPATNYSFQTVPAPPGADSSYAFGISSDGKYVVGGFASANSRQNGFIHGPSGQQVIAYPGANETTAIGVNESGTVVGNYGPGGSFYSGFFYRDGKYVPTNDGRYQSAEVTGINDLGAAVSTYENPVVGTLSVLLSNGTLTPIQYPAVGSATYASGINSLGEIVGPLLLNRTFVGFTDVNGVFSTVEVPGATGTYVEGISNNGNIVGFYSDSSGNSHGFTLISGQFTTIDYPGAADTLIYGIDDAGDVVGWYSEGPCTLSGGSCGFLATAQ